MLLGVSVVFLLTTAPSALYFLALRDWPTAAPTDAQGLAKLRLVFAATNIVYYINNAVNFLLYCLTGSRFRRAMLDLWAAQRRGWCKGELL